tara:strand:+ start:344 stop:490 length:147 start_codon:yes stop_codon:yes gene_type:complete
VVQVQQVQLMQVQLQELAVEVVDQQLVLVLLKEVQAVVEMVDIQVQMV